MTTREQLKNSLLHTWPILFAHHGNFTSVQRQAIPPILAGRDTLVVAATATGKTEAVIAPLIERYLVGKSNGNNLEILYICPTRALVRDLYERLAPPLKALGISLGTKTGDTSPLPTTNPPAVLLTTPESTDSLLTRAARLFIPLRAIVLDEIHLFDNSPRGDHLRCLLPRIERIRSYAQPGQPAAQRIALSATVPDPEGVAARYLLEPTIVQVAGRRNLSADIAPMHGLADLVTALAARPVHKSLVFCNTRNEVEQVAAYLRRNLPYETAVFVHYSNLDRAMRHEVETQFAQAGVALCVCSSTLELGIDIGSIDEVVLIGPPPTITSFLQRIGRGGRRTDTTRVLCLPRSPLERLRFEALISHQDFVSHRPGLGDSLNERLVAYHFRPSVLVQQIFSLLKQSPTGSIRLADLRRIAPEEVPDEDLSDVLNHLSIIGYLRGGPLGEYRPGSQLDDLIDRHEIYSNIGGGRLAASIVDAYSGRRIAQADRPYLKGETLLMGGRPMQVAWRDKYTFGIQRGQRDEVEEQLRFRTVPFAVPLEVAQALAVHLGLMPGQMPCLLAEDGMWLFHFWGEIYGRLLAAVLQVFFPTESHDPQIRPWNEICLWVPFSLLALPPWELSLAERELRRLARRIAPVLELGRFHDLLSAELAVRTVIQQCDLSRFQALYNEVVFCSTGKLQDQLMSLL